MIQKSILITGGLGQVGMGVAELANIKGLNITIVGKSNISQKDKFYAEFIKINRIRYISFDIYDSLNSEKLQALTSENNYWLNTTEPYLQEGDDSEWKEKSQRLYKIALVSGYVKGNNEGKLMIRVGSPPVEVWEDQAFSSNSFVGWPEDEKFDFRKHASFSGDDAYFKNKITFKKAANDAINEEVALISVAPSLVIGPYSNHGKDYELWPQIVKRKVPFNVAYPSEKTSVITLAKLAEGILLAFDKGKVGEVYQLSDLYIGLDKLMKMHLETAMNLGLAKRGKVPVSFPVRNPFPNLTYKWARFNQSFFDKMNFKSPTWMKPELIALHILMGKRNSSKAQVKLDFTPGGIKELEESIENALLFYRKIDAI